MSPISAWWRSRLEHDHGQVADLTPQSLRDAFEVVAHRCVEIDGSLCRGPDHDLVHVDVGGVQQASALRGGEDSDRSRCAVGAEVGAFERVHSDVDRGNSLLAAARTELLADEEHRRLVALAFADDDAAVDLDFAEAGAHRFGRQLIGAVTVAHPHGPGRRDRGYLGDLDQCLFDFRPQTHRAVAPIEASFAAAPDIGGWKAGIPVMAWPITRPWMS